MQCLFFKRPLMLSWTIVLLFSFLVSSPKVFAAASTVSLSPNQGSAGTLVTGSGSNWTATHKIQVMWEDQSTNLGQTTVDSNGNFTVSFTIPSTATQGNHTIYFTDATGNLEYFIPQTFTVTSTPPPNPKPVPTVDLQTSDIHSLQPLLANSSPTLRADIRNNGSVSSGNFNIRWIADGNIADGGHYSIPAGAVDTHDYIWHNLTSGRHTITFIANFDHGITESDYRNNQFTLTFTVSTPTPPTGQKWLYDAGMFAGKSSQVSSVDISGNYKEPDGKAFWNYCGPGASQILISSWTKNVPSIQTLAIQEKTNQRGPGTWMTDMVTPINSAIGQNYYTTSTARSQRDFSNMIGRDILNNHHPLITGIQTAGNGYTLPNWDHSAPHIITIYGFDFTSPTVGYIYYYETASASAGARAGAWQTHRIEYNAFWSLVQFNSNADIQLHGK